MATLTLPRAQSLGALKPILEEDCFPVFEQGRRCAHGSCITVLCQFNPGPACYCHSAKRFQGPNEDPETAQPGQWESE
jgi:hypothetical protein